MQGQKMNVDNKKSLQCGASLESVLKYQKDQGKNNFNQFSFVIDDFDLNKLSKEARQPNKEYGKGNQDSHQGCTKRKEIRTTDTSVKRILDEAEHRKDEFKKLIDEHNAVVENIKKIEAQEIDENENKSNGDKLLLVDCLISTK